VVHKLHRNLGATLNSRRRRKKNLVPLARDFLIPELGYGVDGWGANFDRARAGFTIWHGIQIYSPAHQPSSCVPRALFLFVFVVGCLLRLVGKFNCPQPSPVAVHRAQIK
jgi:hypothetical protein